VTANGRTLAAVVHPALSDEDENRNETEWFVCCHGLVSDKSGSYERRCERAVEAGYDAVRFDFGGCGESAGTFAESTLSARVADLRAVLDHFVPDSERSCVLFGSSFGAKAALHAAVDDARVRAVAGRAPVTYNRTFDDVRERIEETGNFTYAPGKTVDRRFVDDLDRHPFADVAGALDVPVALFHGTADERVALADSLDATAALDGDVLLATFAGEGHRFSGAAETRMRRHLFDWLAAV
jgi:pimeloyl-ACP methyl ester carboxylesterase